MYQFNVQAGAWPPLELDPYLTFLSARLDLQPGDLVTLVLGDDALVRPLNAAYRGKDRPTNVLSFASDAADELGDLIFAFETIAQEAEEQNKRFDDHLKHLILHGSLHLLGYDHETQTQAAEMEGLERTILAEHGLPNPYDLIDD